MLRSINATLMRGGTSRGVFLLESDVPGKGRDDFLVRLMGSPDPLQVDGLGGGFSSTSKAMLVRKSKDNALRIDYLFAQIFVNEAKVDYSGNCGNLTSAVGPFAVDRGLVQAPLTEEPRRFEVDMFNVNTKKRVLGNFMVVNGKTDYGGNNHVPGVPDSGAEVEYKILDPSGTATEVPLLEPALPVDFEGKRVEVSVIDVSSVYAFVEPEVLGLTGVELPSAVNSNPELLARAERLRRSVKLSLGDRLPAAKETEDSPLALRLVLATRAKSFKDGMGKEVKAEDADVMVRAFSMGKMHHAVPFTAALCIAAASKIPGTIVYRNVKPSESEGVRIAHPKGVAVAAAGVTVTRGKPNVEYVKGSRTVRLLMDGQAFVQG